MRGLTAALIVDNLGSGLFLPLTVVFVVRSAGLSLGAAGALITLGTLAGLLAPAVVSRVGDRVGPRAVVGSSMLLQTVGLLCYLLARSAVLVVLAAALVAAGTQTFYSALFALISEIAGVGPKDHVFVSVAMARLAAFGTGSLLAAWLLTVATGTTALRVAVAVDAASFVLAAALLVVLVPSTGGRVRTDRPTGRVGQDRPFLVLIVTVALFALVSDVFLVGLPVYALTVLHTSGWVPGVCLAMLTIALATLSGVVVRRLSGVPRTSSMAFGAACFVGWCLLSALASTLPAGWVAAWLVASTLVLIAGALTAETRTNAMAEAAAPAAQRGRYLAVFQYAFTAAGLLAPLVVALFSVTAWLPWLVLASSAALGASALPWLSRHLPAAAVHVDASR